MKKIISNKITLTIFGIILFFLLWWLISACIGNGNRIFPNPWDTIVYSANLLADSYIYLCIGYSFGRMLLGFLIAAILGIILGSFVGNIKKSKYVFNPTIVAIKAIPTAAVVYLFMVLIGASSAPIFIVGLITFPIVYEATVGGFSNIPEPVLNSLKLDSNNFIAKNVKVKLPLATPIIVVGLISSFALSFKIEIMSEVISGSTSYGLGCAIRTAQADNPANMLPVFGYSFIAIVFILIVSLILYVLKKMNSRRM